VCGILEEIDWMSVVKDCAEVVRVKIKCRDSTRIPAGRLFHFQGKFHQLLFEAEGEPAMGVAQDPPTHLLLLMMKMMSMEMMDKLVRGRMAWILTEVLSLEMLLLVLLW
jgi:hypothetical protein